MQLCVSYGIKDGPAPIPRRAKPFHQANHHLIVRNENYSLLKGQWIMEIADFKRNLHRLAIIRWINLEDRFDGGLNSQIPIHSNI